MKKVIITFFLVFSTIIFAQKQTEKIKFFDIQQNAKLKGNGYQLVLKEVVSDSRCPQGVTCIWAGEVQFVVSVYKDKKLVENETITLAPNQGPDYKEWFSKYLPKCKKNVKSIGILPYPKEGNPINTKEYFLRIGYVKK
ncbi:MAG: hypothetical protein V4548_06510 [Bacteroidota bacterium]